MKISEKHEKLMDFIYDEYNRNSAFLAHGQYALVLVGRSGIRFGDGEAQLAAIRHLTKQGWIEILPTSRTRRRIAISSTSRIRPTNEGILHVEERRQPWLKQHWPTLVAKLTEGLVAGLKRLLP